MPCYRPMVPEMASLRCGAGHPWELFDGPGKQVLRRPVNAHGYRLSEPEVLVGGSSGAEPGGRAAAGRAPVRGADRRPGRGPHANVCGANGCSVAANGCGKRRPERLRYAWHVRFLAQSNDKVTISAKIACVAASIAERNHMITVSQTFILSGYNKARSVVRGREPILTDWQDDAYAIHGQGVASTIARRDGGPGLRATVCG